MRNKILAFIYSMMDWWFLRKHKPIYINHTPKKSDPEVKERKWIMPPYVINGKIYYDGKEVKEK